MVSFSTAFVLRKALQKKKDEDFKMFQRTIEQGCPPAPPTRLPQLLSHCISNLLMLFQDMSNERIEIGFLLHECVFAASRLYI
jgi:hypothetical protein